MFENVRSALETRGLIISHFERTYVRIGISVICSSASFHLLLLFHRFSRIIVSCHCYHWYLPLLSAYEVFVIKGYLWVTAIPGAICVARLQRRPTFPRGKPSENVTRREIDKCSALALQIIFVGWVFLFSHILNPVMYILHFTFAGKYYL